MTDHETENRNYNLPEAGEEDWHIPVNANWEDIDADVANALGLEVRDNGTVEADAEALEALDFTTDLSVSVADGVATIESTAEGGEAGETLATYDVYVYQHGADDYEAVDDGGGTIASGSDGWSVLESAVSATPFGGRLFFEGEYTSDSTISITDSITIRGPSAHIQAADTFTGYHFEADNETYHTITDFSAAVNAGDATLEVSDTASIDRGDIIMMEATDQGTPMGRDQPPGEAHTVIGVDGSTVSIDDSIVWRDGYSTGTGTEVRVIDPIEVNLHGFEIENHHDDTVSDRGVKLIGCSDCLITDLRIDSAGFFGILVEQCARVTVRDCYVDRALDNDNNGYGIGVWAASHDIIFSNNVVKDCRHAYTVTPGGSREIPCRNVLLADSFISGSESSAINAHGGSAHDVRVEGCVVHQRESSPCIRTGAMDTYVSGCRLIDGSAAVEERNDAEGRVLTVEDTTSIRNARAIHLTRDDSVYKTVSLDNVNIYDSGMFSIEINDPGHIESMSITNCHIGESVEEGVRITGSVDDLTIVGNTFAATNDRHIYARDDTTTDIGSMLLADNKFVDPGNDSTRFYHLSHGVISNNHYDVGGETCIRASSVDDSCIAKNNTFYTTGTGIGGADSASLESRDNDLWDGASWTIV